MWRIGVPVSTPGPGALGAPGLRLTANDGSRTGWAPNRAPPSPATCSRSRPRRPCRSHLTKR
eukprot:589757-Alexandrium_andersonii.AAC.1